MIDSTCMSDRYINWIFLVPLRQFADSVALLLALYARFNNFEADLTSSDTDKIIPLHYTSTIAQLFEVSPGLRGQWHSQTPHIRLNGTTRPANDIPCLNYLCWLDRSGKTASTSCGTMRGPSLSLLKSPTDTPMRESRLVPNPFAPHESRPHYRRPGHPFINDDVFQCGSKRDGLAAYKLVKH